MTEGQLRNAEKFAAALLRKAAIYQACAYGDEHKDWNGAAIIIALLVAEVRKLQGT